MSIKLPRNREKPTDEMCYCGHLRSEHFDLPYETPSAIGKANCTNCECPRFMWKNFVYDTFPKKEIFE